MSQDQLIVSGVGSTDWAGGVAPSGGSHTGISQITMVSGTKFTVASNRVETLRKTDLHAIARTDPMWVAFDVPLSGLPVILNVANIQSVK